MRNHRNIYHIAATTLRALVLLPAISLGVACAPTVPTPLATSTPVEVPVAGEGEDLVKDSAGNLHYIVVFHDDAADAYPKETPSDSRLPVYEKAHVRNFIYDIESKYGFESTSMTSWVGITLAAYLTPAQAQEIAKHPSVKRIALDHWLSFSAEPGPLWSDVSVSANEVQSWGKQAVNPSSASSSGAVTVYVIDGGVGNHPDLNVVKRVYALDWSDEAPAHLVGCYAHGTHVAGIIGAKADGKGVQGINPGARIVSLAAIEKLNTDTKCLGREGPSDTGIIQSLNWVMGEQDYGLRNKTRAGIINISINSPLFRSGETIGELMKKVAKKDPAKDYPGAFIVQSAGNSYADACAYAYDGATKEASWEADGIMVVGAIDDHGQPVVPLNGLYSSRNCPYARNEPGSNHGPCVEAWAPGKSILSTWANMPQSATNPDNTYTHLSGTSMAAPHIAGLAAFLAETHTIIEPEQIEVRVRKEMHRLVTEHPAHSSPDAHLHLPSLAIPDADIESSPYAEFATWAGVVQVPSWLKEPCAADPHSLQAVNRDLAVYDGDGFILSIDSVGAGATGCDVFRVPLDESGVPIGPSESIPSEPVVTNARRTWTSPTWSLGFWQIGSVSCPSASARVHYRKPSVSRWFVDSVDRTGETVTLLTTNSSELHYESENATNCSLMHELFDNPPEVSGAVEISTTEDYGPKGDVQIPTKIGYHKYTAICEDAYGDSRMASVVIRITAPSHDAQFITQTVHTQVTAGKPFPVSLTFKNTGSSAQWTAIENFRLGSQNPQDNTTWGSNRQSLAPGEFIGLTDEKTFSFDAFAPSTPGTYPFQWRMLQEGVGWFGEPSPLVQIQVVPPAIQPKSGSWYNPARSGWGLHVSHDANGTVALTWTTYRPNGTPIWYIAETQEVGGKFTGPLYTAEWVNNQEIKTLHGELALTTTSATTGDLSWVLDGVPGSEHVEYFLFGASGSAPNLTGAWYAPGQPGLRLAIDVQGDLPGSAVAIYDASGQPTWVTYNGGSWNGTAFNVMLAQVSGVNLCPGCTGASSYSIASVGTMLVKNVNGSLDGATLDLSLSGALAQWSQTGLPIARQTY